ncbi:uncharacterized protein LOC129586865 [Paramacrobiotus metropolitanus]|uniref:uncharacterized protein LOC129586865 n=1 Tax=Paramacrobiotus metropolitanus TaxID=2943436 RepID=UPI0024464950|nr:uncharacterized protein LOC129586865 [Paramacrobiotus metropolitanus]
MEILGQTITKSVKPWSISASAGNVSHDFHAASSSTGFTATADIYAKIIAFLSSNANGTSDTALLLDICEGYAISTALLNHKLGQFVNDLVDDLFEQLTVANEESAIKDARTENKIPVNDIVADILVAGGLLMVVIVRSITGQWDSSILSDFIKSNTPQAEKKVKRLRLRKLWRKVRKWASQTSPAMSHPGDDLQLINVDFSRQLTDNECNWFLGFMMELGNIIFGADVGPMVGLRYAMCVFELGASMLPARRSDETATARTLRLTSWITRLQHLCHSYHLKLLGNTSLDSGAEISSDCSVNVPKFDPAAKNILRFEAIELVGKVVADVVRSVQETTLHRALQFVVAEHACDGRAELSECRSEIQQANVNKLKIKIEEFTAFLHEINKCTDVPGTGNRMTHLLSFSASTEGPGDIKSKMDFTSLKQFWTAKALINQTALSNVLLAGENGFGVIGISPGRSNGERKSLLNVADYQGREAKPIDHCFGSHP